jgi:hypothetical protein
MNGSLMHDSKTQADVTMEDIENTMTNLYASQFSRMVIGQTVRKIEEDHQAALGGHARFWALLGIGAILAHPKSYKHKIAHYLTEATKCLDQDADLQLNFYTDLQTELKRRYDAGTIQMQDNARLLYLSPYLHTIRMLGET